MSTLMCISIVDVFFLLWYKLLLDVKVSNYAVKWVIIKWKHLRKRKKEQKMKITNDKILIE